MQLFLYHFRDIWHCRISWPWNRGWGSFAMQIYEQSIRRWTLQTQSYLFADDSVDLSSFTSTQQVPRKAICCKVVCYGLLRSFMVIEVGTNQKPICDFLLVFCCNYVPIFCCFRGNNDLLVEFFFAVLPSLVSLEAIISGFPWDLGNGSWY